MLTKEEIKQAKKKYAGQRDCAINQRNISWLFTFDTRITVWVSSGKWHKRGTNKSDFCMARFNDTGPYSPENVKIITFGENRKEQRFSKKTKDLMRSIRIGRYTGLENSHRVGCICEGINYPTLISAARFYNITYQAIPYRINSKNYSNFCKEI